MTAKKFDSLAANSAFLIGMTLCVSPSFAAPRAPLSRLEQSSALIRAIAPGGHHFNLKAPRSLSVQLPHPTTLKPTQESPAEIRFNISGAQPSQYQVTVFICDDANTFCEKQLLQSASALSLSEKIKPLAPVSLSPSAKQTSLPAHLGWEESWNLALQKASLTKKPLLLVFSAVWCPPCNWMDEDLFQSPDFKKRLNQWVAVKIDVDRPANASLMADYQVREFPTVVLTNTKGEEISRWVGYSQRDLALAEMQAAWADRDQTPESLAKKIQQGDTEAAFTLGKRLYNRKNYPLALAYLEKTKHTDWIYLARLKTLESGKEKVSLLEKWSQETPTSALLFLERIELAEAYRAQQQPEKAEQAERELVEHGKKLLAQPALLNPSDLLAGDVAYEIAEAYRRLNEPQAAKSYYRESAQQFDRLKMQLTHTRELSRGIALNQAAALWHADDFSAAEKIYKTFEARYPNDHTFFYGHARMLFAQKDFAAAWSLGTRALDLAYDENLLRTADGLIAQWTKAETPQGEQNARKIYERVLPLLESTHKNSRYAQRLLKKGEALKQNP